MTAIEKSEEEFVPHSSYSHGLEAIYSLETIDPKTIRKLSSTCKQPKCEIPKKKENRFEEPKQLELPLGEGYQDWIEPFFLHEPIAALHLSPQAERILSKNKVSTIKDLVEINIAEFTISQGLGQGHVDEIQNQLSEYIDGRALDQTTILDFGAWMRSLTVGLTRIEARIFLEEYQLGDIYPLPFAEVQKVRFIDDDKRKRIVDECHSKMRSTETTQKVHQGMKRVANCFLTPWIRKRQGLVIQSELEERISRVSSNPQIAERAIQLLSVLYYQNQLPWEEYLYKVDDNVFASDKHSAMLYQRVIRLVREYFYRPGISYKRRELESFLLKEACKRWDDIDETFLLAVFRKSPELTLRKDFSGELILYANVASP